MNNKVEIDPKYKEWIDVLVKEKNVNYRCKKSSEEMVEAFPELSIARGYACHSTGWKQVHYWCKLGDIVIDPTLSQFLFPDKTSFEEYDESVHGPCYDMYKQYMDRL